MNKDYYNILGIDKYSTHDDIKKAYRKLALKYHPDKNNNDEEFKKKFHDVNEAYNVLINSEKRKKYDMFGVEDNDLHFDEDPFKMFNTIFKEHLSQFKNMQYENNFDIGNIINELSGLNIGNLFDIPKVHVKVNSYGDNKKIDINKLFTNLDTNYLDSNNYVEEIIDDIVIHLNIDIEEIYNNKKRKISYEKKKYKKGELINKKVKLDIDLYDKEIVLKGNGNETLNKKGDVMIYLHCGKNDFVRINDYDVYYQKKVNLKEFYLKKYVEIVLPNNEKLYLKDIKPNQLIKINKKGIPYINNEKNYNGNLFCYISVDLPEFDCLYDMINEISELEDDLNESNKNFTEYKYVDSYEVFNTE